MPDGEGGVQAKGNGRMREMKIFACGGQRVAIAIIAAPAIHWVRVWCVLKTITNN